MNTIALLLAFAALPITPILVDDQVTGYATFQSHNQKVVANSHGIFLAYIRTRNEAFTAQQWRLVRSVDGGANFTTVYESTDATNPPVIETDAEDNLYLIRPNFQETNAYLYLFRAEKDYKDPAIHTIPNGSAGKYAMAIDLPRKQLYYASHNGYLAIIGLDGTVKSSVQTHITGPIAVQQYPHLLVDAEGVLHFAWTTNNNDKYLYRDIHYMRSRDAGQTWQRLDGQPLTLPVIADDAGPSDRISLDDEFEVHTWLSSMAVIQDKLHFVYLAQFPEAPREHYMRYDLATGKREIDSSPTFKGDDLQVASLDGFFTSPATKLSPAPLFYTSQYSGHIVTLRSDDNGSTWRGHALSETAFSPYAISGARSLSPDGNILGAFTDQSASSQPRLYLLRIPTLP